MENFDELPFEELTDGKVDLVSGGWMKQLTHMDYHNMNNFNDPTRSDTLEVANSKKGATDHGWNGGRPWHQQRPANI